MTPAAAAAAAGFYDNRQTPEPASQSTDVNEYLISLTPSFVQIAGSLLHNFNNMQWAVCQTSTHRHQTPPRSRT